MMDCNETYYHAYLIMCIHLIQRMKCALVIQLANIAVIVRDSMFGRLVETTVTGRDLLYSQGQCLTLSINGSYLVGYQKIS